MVNDTHHNSVRAHTHAHTHMRTQPPTHTHTHTHTQRTYITQESAIYWLFSIQYKIQIQMQNTKMFIYMTRDMYNIYNIREKKEVFYNKNIYIQILYLVPL